MSRFNKPNMHRKFIALVLSLAVAVTGFAAAPARADEDVAKVLFGLTALAILGAAIHDHRKDKKQAATRNSTNLHSHKGRGNGHRTHREHRHDGAWDRPRPLPDRVARFTLPAQCERPVTGHPRRTAMGMGCLRKNYRFVDTLPADCRIEFHNGRKFRSGYGTRCLRNRGYRLSFN